MKAKEPRKQRAYKATDEHYWAAFNRAEEEGGYLANLIENVIIGYGAGLNVVLTNKKSRQIAKPNRLNGVQ